jgi:hypothetical protein
MNSLVVTHLFPTVDTFIPLLRRVYSSSDSPFFDVNLVHARDCNLNIQGIIK